MDCFAPQQHAELAARNSIKFDLEHITRLLFKISIDFCGLDLFNNEFPRLSERPANTTTPAPKGEEKGRPRWALFARGLYFYATTRILVYVCLQYMYDFDWYAHESLRKSDLQLTSTANTSSNTKVASSVTSNASATTDDQLQLLGQRIERDIRRLKLVGAPLMRLHFASELLYIYLAWAVFVMYYRSQLYFRHIKPFDVSLLRAVLDWEREQAQCDKMIQHEVDKFCISNWNFVRSHCGHWSSSAGRSRFQGYKFSQLSANFGQTADKLNRMAADGSLRPLNRSHVWIKHTSRWMGYFSLLNIFSQIVFIASLFVYMPQSQLLEMIGIETAPMDLVFIVETLVFAYFFDVISLNFYLTVVTFNTLDQIRMVDELNKLIQCCIRSNNRAFEQIHAGCAGRLASMRCFDEMNSNLLFVVMSYKIFVSQTKASRDFTAYVVFMDAELVVLLPVLCLISSQYLTTNMLCIAVGCSLALTTMGDISMAPCCYYHSRHLRTYRSLHSLLAHTVDLRRRGAVDALGRPYDSHTVRILAKELNEPDMLLKQFAIKLFGVHFSFKNFLKIHFWCGILGILGYYVTSGPSKGGILEKTIKFF